MFVLMSRQTFISHSSADGEVARVLLAALEERGLNCWIAPRNITAGAPYGEAILTAIEASAALVLIYTTNCNSSRHVAREVERALHLGINIIPVRFDSSTPSKNLDYFLATVHWLSALSDRGKVEIERVVPQIVHAVNSSGPANLEPRNAQIEDRGVRRVPKVRRGLVAAGVTVFAAACIAGAVTFVAGRPAPSRAPVVNPSAAPANAKTGLQPQTAIVEETPAAAHDEPGRYRGKKKEITPTYVDPRP